jgi:hypothetical protein
MSQSKSKQMCYGLTSINMPYPEVSSVLRLRASKSPTWCLLPFSVLISTRMFCNEVASGSIRQQKPRKHKNHAPCDTCQCSPVADAPGGIRRRSMTRLRAARKKLFWFMCQLRPPGKYGFASMTAIPSKSALARMVGGLRASPTSWV